MSTYMFLTITCAVVVGVTFIGIYLEWRFGNKH